MTHPRFGLVPWLRQVKSSESGRAQRRQGSQPLSTGPDTGAPPLRAVRAPTPARDAEAFRSWAHDERGSVTIWLATATFAMISLVGLVVDLGGQVHAQQRTYDIAAQAARTGGQSVQAAPAVTGEYARIDSAAARQAAQAYLSSAGVAGSVSIHDGNRIVVSCHDTYRTKFLSIVGISKLTVHGDATAHLVRTLGGSPR